MNYNNITKGIFLDRPNRFIANVRIGDEKQTVHVKNTGRCKEILIPGVTVYLASSDNPARKTKYDLIAVEKNINGKKEIINIDSQAPNAAVKEWLPQCGLFSDNAIFKSEVKYKNSRFDFCITENNHKTYAEVKGVTLEQNGVALFPDSPTERDVKHIKELIECKKEGYGAYIIFVVQMKGISAFTPSIVTHKEFADTLTIKKIYNTFIEYRNKVDVFYVAFSGGKDSVVSLDLVQRALPHNEFKVLFGDTGMEFPDTYTTVEVIKQLCAEQDIEFITAKSDFEPVDTWHKFGPPATVHRWCCSVHKTSPQITTLRKVLNKSDFTGMAFIGVRASESLSRNEYDYVSLGEKHKGRYSCNPILEWNSAELYTYIYSENLYLNEAYKKGNRRAGCLVCPRAAERNEYMAQVCYPDEFNKFISMIREMYTSNFSSERKLDEFMANGGWKARKNGRDISTKINYEESSDKKYGYITIHKPKTEWKEWIKTIGILQNDESPYMINFRNQMFKFEVDEVEGDLKVRYSIDLAKTAPLFVKLLKNVFRKSACCVGCRECEADCHNGVLKIREGKVTVGDGCLHCSQCHKVEKGCLVYKSLELPKGGQKMGKTQSLNCFSHHAPKMEWINQYFEYKNEFKEKNTLGSQMFNFFKRFLKDAGLQDDNGFTRFAQIIDDIGLDADLAWGLILSNLAYNPQIGWYIKNVPFNETMSKEYICSLLVDSGADEKWVNDVWSSFGRLVDLQFSKVGMGDAVKEKSKLIAVYRTGWSAPDERVILYS